MRASSLCPSVSALAPPGAGGCTILLPCACAPGEDWGSLLRAPTTPCSRGLGARAAAGGRCPRGCGDTGGLGPHHGATPWAATSCDSSLQCSGRAFRQCVSGELCVKDLGWGRTGSGGAVAFSAPGVPLPELGTGNLWSAGPTGPRSAHPAAPRLVRSAAANGRWLRGQGRRPGEGRFSEPGASPPRWRLGPGTLPRCSEWVWVWR